jgi:hypothetical protein
VTTVLRVLAVVACIDLALLGLILATHWWRRNDPCRCGCGVLNDYDGGDVYDQELDTPDFQRWTSELHHPAGRRWWA